MGLWMWVVVLAEHLWAAVTWPWREHARRRKEQEARDHARGVGKHRRAQASAPGSVAVGGDNTGTISTSVTMPDHRTPQAGDW